MTDEPPSRRTFRVPIVVAAEGWAPLSAERRRGLRRAVRGALALEPRARGLAPADVVLVLADDEVVRELNARHRGKDRPTNVLSFTNDDPPGPGERRHLGDIVLALETCTAEARAQAKPLDHHLAHLALHGALHLLGHDHEEEAEASRMEALEVRALARLGIPDPYNDDRGSLLREAAS